MRHHQLFASGIAAVVLTAAGCTSSSAHPAASAPTSARPSATATADPADAAILATVNGLITVETTMYNDAAPNNSLYTYAADAAATYLSTTVETLRGDGIESIGTLTLRDATVSALSTTPAPQTATVTACLDATKMTQVYMTDPSQSAVAPGSPPAAPHPLTLQVQLLAQGWRVTQYDVNGDATC